MICVSCRHDPHVGLAYICVNKGLVEGKGPIDWHIMAYSSPMECLGSGEYTPPH